MKTRRKAGRNLDVLRAATLRRLDRHPPYLALAMNDTLHNVDGGHGKLPGGRRESHPPAPTDPHVSLSTHTARAVWLEDAAPQYRQCTNSSGFRVRIP